jgi:hypothetical protein
MLSISKYYAVYSDSVASDGTQTSLEPLAKTAQPALNLGMGMDFFLSSTIAVKLDARSYLYVGKEPQYDPDEDPSLLASRVYNNFVASTGVSVFFPKMKPRNYNF